MNAREAESATPESTAEQFHDLFAASDGGWQPWTADLVSDPAADTDWTGTLVAFGIHHTHTVPGEARVRLSHACAQPGAGWINWYALGVACMVDGAFHSAVAALDIASQKVPGRKDIERLRHACATAAANLGCSQRPDLHGAAAAAGGTAKSGSTAALPFPASSAQRRG